MSTPTVTNFSRYLGSHLDPQRPASDYGVMPKRPLGGTGIHVGAIGLGTRALSRTGLAAVPDAEIRFTLGQALDMQASLIDVSFADGQGRALRQLGWALQGRRAAAVVSLRVGQSADGGRDDSADGVRQQVEAALNVLGTDHVDLVFWDRPAFGGLKAEAPALLALAALRKEGKLRAWGVNVDEPEAVRAALEQTGAQVLQFPFNVFFQGAAASFADAAAKGVGLVARQPLDSGWLTGRYGVTSLFMDARRRWSLGVRARRAGLQKAFEQIAMRPNQRAQEAALSFVLSHPEIGCAVAGVSTWQQVVANVDAARVTLEPAQVAALKALWRDKIQGRDLPL
jgi:aryl-alcohol dehydrogenase-like predicted oxidoreductase